MSQALVKLQRKGQMVIPRALREEAGVAEGTLMKVRVVKGGQFVITPQLTIDRSVVNRGRKELRKVFHELAEAVADLRQDATGEGLNAITKTEINRAVATVRRDLKKSTKRPAK